MVETIQQYNRKYIKTEKDNPSTYRQTIIINKMLSIGRWGRGSSAREHAQTVFLLQDCFHEDLDSDRIFYNLFLSLFLSRYFFLSAVLAMVNFSVQAKHF